MKKKTISPHPPHHEGCTCGHMHPHGHDHEHDHHHHHTPTHFGRAFAIGIALNIGFVAVETAYGLYANSTALLADAGHNLSDVLGLLVAWVAYALSTRKATATFTYGLGNSSILAALFNALLLLAAVGFIGWEAIGRFSTPQPVAGNVMMAVAAVGIVINGLTAWLFMRGSHDLNLRGAYLHMLADAGVSLGVVVAGLVITLTGWQWLDPTISLAIAALILASTWGLLRDSVRFSLAAVPPEINLEGVHSFLLSLKGVKDVHDLHIWPLSTTQTALTCHLVVSHLPEAKRNAFLLAASKELKEHFNIQHTTLQIEEKGPPACLQSQTCLNRH